MRIQLLYRIVCLTALAATTQCYAQHSKNADEVWKHLTARFAKAESVEGEYTTTQSQSDRSSVATFHFIIRRPNNVRAWFSSNGQKPVDIVVDGKTSWMLFHSTNMFLSNESHGEDFGMSLPIGLHLFRHEPIGSRIELASRQLGHVVFKGKHVLALSLKRVDSKGVLVPEKDWLYLDPSTQIPVGAMRLISGPDRRTHVTTYTRLRLNPPIPKNTFAFVMPKGAEPYREPDSIAIGNPAPMFAGESQDDQKVDLTTLLKGQKALLVNFWNYG